jgi:ribulose-5-phosphate 4-epimerase/fuculose-1-phosphate aldolase
MCRAELEGNNLLQKYLEHRDDLGKYEGRDGNDLQLDYAGVDVPLAPGSDTFEEMRRAQEEMKRVGRLTARQKCSRTHIVMSVAIGSEWEGCAGVDEQRFAVMTAEKTDKTNLLIPSQTPVVSKRGSTWLFYGDPSTRPTSELVSHWTIHQKLCASSSAWRRRRAIFHAHMIELIELSRRHLEQTIAPVGGKAVPNLDWTNHGTIRLGEQIAAGMLERDSQIAIVKHHGPWFVSESLEQGLDMALDAVHKVRQSDTRPV